MDRGRVEVQRVGSHITDSTYSMVRRVKFSGLIAALPNCASLSKGAARALSERQGLATICTHLVGLLKPLNSPPCRSPCRTRTFASCAQSSQPLRRHFHEDAALHSTCASCQAGEAPLKPLSTRSGGRISSSKLWFCQVLRRNNPERLRRHLHVVVATFDGR